MEVELQILENNPLLFKVMFLCLLSALQQSLYSLPPLASLRWLSQQQSKTNGIADRGKSGLTLLKGILARWVLILHSLAPGVKFRPVGIGGNRWELWLMGFERSGSC